MQAVGQIAEGTAYLRQGRFNGRIADRNALNAERDASAEVAQVREQVRQTMGQQLVAQGGSGFEVGTGTAFDALTESQVNGMVDAMALRRRGSSAADAYRQQGQLARMQGRTAATAKYFGAAAELGKTAANYAGGAA